jgi:HAD superfamily hydrolase (TIGR01662 family)
MEGTRKDFFISRSGADAGWAQWIAWQLEAAGYSVIVQDWDFQPGSNFMRDIRRALDTADTTIAVYSPDYFKTPFTEDEWSAAIVTHEDDEVRFLPIRVAEVEVPRLLKPLVYVDLVGLSEEAARTRLLDAAKRRSRRKPSTAPRFPAAASQAPQFPSVGDAAEAPRQVRVVNAAPIELSRFTDRLEEVQMLRGFLGDASVRLVTIVGRVGIGKSALVSHVLAANAALNESQLDAIIFLSSRTTDMSLERLYADLRRLLDEESARHLGEAWARTDVTLRESVDMLLDSLGERRIIAVLDGLGRYLEDGVITVEGLRTFVEACLERDDAPRLVVTSRVDMTVPPAAFPFVRSLRLRQGLPVRDAVNLLRALDPQGELGLADASELDLERAVELAAGIPRALEILAGILNAAPEASLSGLLSDERALGSQVVEGLVAEAFNRLGSHDQRVLEVMAAFDGPVTLAAVSFVVHTWFPEIEVRPALRRLVASYFTTAARDRGEYIVQSTDRLHLYQQIPVSPAASAGSSGMPSEYHRAAVESRVADYYASVGLPPSEWRSIESVGPQIAEFQHRVLAGEVDRALEVLNAIDSNYLFQWGHYARLIELRQRVLELPARPELQAANVASLALVKQVLGQFDEAARYYEQAVEFARQANNDDAEAHYTGHLGRLYRNLGYMDKALSCSTRALVSAERAGNREAFGLWQDRLGLVHMLLGRLDEARNLHEQAVSKAREFNDRRGQSAALANLGNVLQFMGLTDEAARAQREALELAYAVDDRRGVPIILGRQGMLAEDNGNYSEALSLHEEALAIAVALGERREESYQLLGRGKAHFGLQMLTEAALDLRAARDLDVPETSYTAALALSIVLTVQGSAERSTAFADTIRRCRERLARSDKLFAARYVISVAMIGAASCREDWNDTTARSVALTLALDELDQAIRTCDGSGIIRATLRDIMTLARYVEGLDPIISRLEGALGESRSRAGLDGNRPMIRAVLLDFGETLVERISDRDAPLTQLAPVLFPESAMVLGELKRAGYLLGIVSNTDQSDEETMNQVLIRLGIRDYIDTAVTSISVGARKPERAIYLRALERLGCYPAEAVMVGDDAPVDIAGAAALGITTILVRRDQSRLAATGADAIVTSLQDLILVLERLQRSGHGS